MLEVVADGIQKYDGRGFSSDKFAVGDAIHQYLKLKLKKENIDLLLLKDKTLKFTPFAKIENSLKSRTLAIEVYS